MVVTVPVMTSSDPSQRSGELLTVAAFPVAVETVILRLLETDDVLSVAVSCKVFSSAPLLCQLSLEHTVQLCGWSSSGIPVEFRLLSATFQQGKKGHLENPLKIPVETVEFRSNESGTLFPGGTVEIRKKKLEHVEFHPERLETGTFFVFAGIPVSRK